MIMWAKRALCIVILFAAGAAFADAVDDYVKAEMARHHIPGLSLAVVKDGKVEKVAGYGLANVELNVPVSPETVFQIQSITKTFTSTAILMLMEEGKLSVDDPISKHLSGTPESWKDITLRHLLSHTSGIKDFINEPTASLRLDVTEEQVLKATAPRPLNFAPGEKYSYSNTNFHLLAMVIRKLTGKSYGDFLRERIFTPLGMSQTRVVSLSELIPNRASGYNWSGGSLHNGEYIAASILGYGGGGVISTAPDMAKWAIAMDTAKLLKKSTIDGAWKGFKLNDGGTSGYGLGWGVGNLNGHRNVGHGGSHMTGFTSNLLIYPDDHLAVVVLTNAVHANPAGIARRVAGIYLPAVMPPPPKAIEDKDPKVTELLKQIANQIAEGKLEADRFTPPLWAILSEHLNDLQKESKSDGELKRVELLSRSRDKDETTYRYRIIFAKRVHLVSLTLDKQGKVSGLMAEEE